MHRLRDCRPASTAATGLITYPAALGQLRMSHDTDHLVPGGTLLSSGL